jgi:hypothetical protein
MRDSILEDESKVSDKALTKTSDTSGIGKLLQNVSNIADLEKIAIVLAASPIYSKYFTTDSKQPADASSIMATLLVGTNMGLSASEAIMYGKTLNQDSMAKISMGNALGVPPLVSMYHIHTVNNVITVDYHIVNMLMNRLGIVRRVIEDYAPIPLFQMLTGGKPNGTVVPFDDKLFVAITDNTSADVLKTALEAGKQPVIPFATTFRTTIEFERTYSNDKTQKSIFSFTIQDAIEAGLCAGNKINGEWSKGKDNWNNYRKTMLRKQVVVTAKELIADVLYGMLSTVEMGFDVKSDIVDAEYSE